MSDVESNEILERFFGSDEEVEMNDLFFVSNFIKITNEKLKILPELAIDNLLRVLPTDRS